MPKSDLLYPAAVFNERPIPRTAPFPAGYSVDPPRPDIRRTSDKTKSRVDRNVNASPLEALYLKYSTIDQSQYEAACLYRYLHRALERPMSQLYGERISGGSGRNGEADGADGVIDAQTRLLRLAQIIPRHYFKPCEMLVIEEKPLAAIAAEMGRGWSKTLRGKRIGEALDALSEALPKTKRALG